MRLFLLPLFLVVFLALGPSGFEVSVAYAQGVTDSSGRVIYGGNRDSGTRLYNAPSSGTRGPLSLRQMLEGRSDAASGSGGNYYGGSNFRPYGISNNNYSLALSPDQIRQSRAKRDALAQRQEREAMRALQQEASYDDMGNATSQYRQQFQPTSARPAPAINTQRKTRFKQRKDGFDVPKKVFNSVR